MSFLAPSGDITKTIMPCVSCEELGGGPMTGLLMSIIFVSDSNITDHAQLMIWRLRHEHPFRVFWTVKCLFGGFCLKIFVRLTDALTQSRLGY